MELGEKLKQARLALGLSQRQLCGDTITRNMLSLIENGAASPSMETLRFLSQQLGKPMSYFLEEEAVTSPNEPVMAQARQSYQSGGFSLTLELLRSFQAPDPVFDWEAALLEVLACLSLAEEAISLGKRPYALALLEQARGAGERTPYYTPELERRRLLSLALLTPAELPGDDRELLLRAERSLTQKDYQRAAEYLQAAQNRQSLLWQYLRGQTHLALQEYPQAQRCLEAAWDHDPKSCAAALEQCCREQEDFKGAYHYACRLRELSG